MFDFLKKNWYFCLIIIFLILLDIGGILGYIFYLKPKEVCIAPPDLISGVPTLETEIDSGIEDTQTEIVVDKIKVDIKGLVNNPGVYELEKGAIVNDLINLAGGIKSNASTENINLSRQLQNEMVVIIYSKNEVAKLKESKLTDNTCKCPEIEITECVNNGSSVIESGENKDNSNESSSETNSSSSETKKISLNTATKEELMTISGIGEAKALAIIEYRSKNKFNSIEELKNISGFGDKLFDQIKDYITV